jgi:hypothetical protein
MRKLVLLQVLVTFMLISTAANALNCKTTVDVWNIYGGDKISYNFTNCGWLIVNITSSVMGEWRLGPNCIEQSAGNFYCTCKDRWTLSLSPKPNSVGTFKITIKDYYEELPNLIVTIISPQNTSYSKSCVPLKFTLNKPVSLIRYSLDNKANITIKKNITLTGLSEGTHRIIVYAKDKSGNETKSNIVYFTIAKKLLGYVDIGKMKDEMAYSLGWSKPQSKTSGGNVWGGVADPKYWRTVSCSYCKWGDSAYAFIPTGENAKTIRIELLDRAEDDSFDVYVLEFFRWVKIGNYKDQSSDSVGKIETTDFLIPSSVHTYGWIEVEIVATGKHWSGYNTYGQLAIHKIEALGVPECNDEHDDKH